MTDWTGIVQEHGAVVWRTAYRLLNHDADASDCFQRTFLSAVELESRQPIRNWPAALARLATARALEQLRSRYRHAERFTALTDDPVVEDSQPIQSASLNELSERLRVALAAIEPKQAEIFCLVCLEGRSNQQAAEQLGITAPHAGVLLQRARGALRERLEAFAPAKGDRNEH